MVYTCGPKAGKAERQIGYTYAYVYAYVHAYVYTNTYAPIHAHKSANVRVYMLSYTSMDPASYMRRSLGREGPYRNLQRAPEDLLRRS